jgi:hypothetical protein
LVHPLTWHMSSTACLWVSDSNFTSARNFFATATSASWGHAVNQSMAQQLIKLGNLRKARHLSATSFLCNLGVLTDMCVVWTTHLRRRSRKASPMGLKASTVWRFWRTRERKKA